MEQDASIHITFDDGFQLDCHSADYIADPVQHFMGSKVHGLEDKADTTGLKAIDKDLSGISSVFGDSSASSVFHAEDAPNANGPDAPPYADLRDFVRDSSVFDFEAKDDHALPTFVADNDSITQHAVTSETNSTVPPVMCVSAADGNMATNLMNKPRRHKRASPRLFPTMPNDTKRRKKSCAKTTPSSPDEAPALSTPSSPSSVDGHDLSMDAGSPDHDEAELAREMKFLYEKAGTKKKKLTHEVLQLLIRDAPACLHVAESGNVSITTIYFFNMFFVLRVLMRAYELALRRAGVVDPKYLEGFRDVQRTAEELRSGLRTPNKTPARLKLDTAWKTHKNDFAKIMLKIVGRPPRGSYKSGQEWILPGTLWEMPTFYGPTDMNSVASQCAAEALRQIQGEDKDAERSLVAAIILPEQSRP